VHFCKRASLFGGLGAKNGTFFHPSLTAADLLPARQVFESQAQGNASPAQGNENQTQGNESRAQGNENYDSILFNGLAQIPAETGKHSRHVVSRVKHISNQLKGTRL
jgi:hypothetical protein